MAFRSLLPTAMASIHLISVGSRGDLEPYLALLEELRRRKHQVHLIGSVNFEEACRDRDLRFTALPGDFQELMGSDTGLQLMEGKAVRLINDDLLAAWLRTARQAIGGCDLLIATPLSFWAYHLAEAAGCRFAVTSPIPLAGTREFSFLQWPAERPAAPGAPRQRLRGRLRQRLRGHLHRLSYRVIRLIKWRQTADVIQAFRADEGLPALPWSGIAGRRDAPPQLQAPPLLHLFSPHVVPRPADWPDNAQVTGYCLAPDQASEAYSPPDDLQAFLADGPPPVYAGFGSMIPRNPADLAEVVIQAACDAGVRLILSPGWGRVLPHEGCPASVFILESCPHQWLFPQLLGAIHHGGAGTTATSLRSGIPSIVVAFFADQPAWGKTLEQLGVSPATHNVTSVTRDALRDSLLRLKAEAGFRQRAQDLQRRIQEDNGVAQTADALEALLPSPASA